MNSENLNNFKNESLNNKANPPHTSISKLKNNIINCFVINNKGKVILSRQFVELSKRKLFELAFLFDRNLNLKKNKDKYYFNLEENFELISDNTKLAFTYHPLHINSIYLVLTTHKNFSIFESLEIIKTIHRKIIEVCQFNSESNEDLTIEKIKSNAFEIILSIDDIINSQFGLEERNLSKILTNYKMESKEAEVFLKNKEIKEKKTREHLIKGMEEIDRLKKENKYSDNSVSSEMFENTIKENSLNVLFEEKSSTSLNLKEMLMLKLREHREEVLRQGKNTYDINCDFL
jgi:hypothetical protein